MDFLSRNAFAVIVSVVVILVFLLLANIVGVASASLGDWGDFVAAAVAAIAFVWLIAGHHANQRQIVATQRDLESQVQATREVVAAFATVAAANKVQAAEIFANALPRFVSTGSLEIDHSPVTFRMSRASGYVDILNQGDIAILIGVRSITDGVVADIEQVGLIQQGGRRRITLKATGSDVVAALPISVILEFDDKIGRRGWAKVAMNAKGELPTIEQGMGGYGDA